MVDLEKEPHSPPSSRRHEPVCINGGPLLHVRSFTRFIIQSSLPFVLVFFSSGAAI